LNTRAHARASQDDSGRPTVTLRFSRSHFGSELHVSEDAARSLLADLRSYFAESADAPYLSN
jgi:hypothetical protein